MMQNLILDESADLACTMKTWLRKEYNRLGWEAGEVA